MVQKGDSIYTIYKNFAYKSQYQYKSFVDVIKKENGMTKGSDILRMKNKMISIPYTCEAKVYYKKVKQTLSKKYIQKVQKKKKLDIYGLQATKTRLKILSAQKTKNNNLKLTTQSSVGSYSSSRINTNELTPVQLKLAKSFDTGIEDTKSSTNISFSNPIYVNGLNKNISNTNFSISQSFIHQVSSIDFGFGAGFNSQNFINQSQTGTQRINGLDMTLIGNYSFESNYYKFKLGSEFKTLLIQTNPSANSAARFSSLELNGTWYFNKDYGFKVFNENSTASLTSSNVTINRLGIGLLVNL
jgi:hypothetical protein